MVQFPRVSTRTKPVAYGRAFLYSLRVDALSNLVQKFHELIPPKDEHERLWRRLYSIISELRSIDFDPEKDPMRAADLVQRCILVIYEVLDYAEPFIELDEAAQEFAAGARNKQARIDLRLTTADSLLQRVRNIRNKHEAIRKMKPQYWTDLTPQNHFIDSEENDYDVSQESSELICSLLKKMVAGKPVYEEEIRPLLPESYKGNVGRYFGIFNKNLTKRGFLAECILRDADPSNGLRYWRLNYGKQSKPEIPLKEDKK